MEDTPPATAQLAAPDPAPDAVLRAVRDQRDAYARLLDLVRHQSEVVAKGHTEALLNVLVQRRGIVRDIECLDATLQPARRDWPAFAANLNHHDRREAEQAIHDIRRMLAEVIEADAADQEYLRSARDHAKQSLDQLNRSAGAARAYQTQPAIRQPAGNSPWSRFNSQPGQPRFADRSA